MNKTFWLCAGLAGGVFLTLAVQYAVERPAEPARAAPTRDSPQLAELRAENERLRKDIATEKVRNDQLQDANNRMVAKKDPVGGLHPPKQSPPAPEAPSDTPPTDDELLKGVNRFGASLGAIMLGGGEDAKKEIRDLMARAGEHGVELLAAKLEDDATDLQLRAVIAHALAQSGNADAIAVLTDVCADPEAGMMELRLASHGLAFSDAPGIDGALLAVAHRSADTGARANASFGLARRKNPEGIGLYMKATDEAMANRDPLAIAYLSGFALLGDEALPPIRERLITYTEPQAVVTVIEILKARGDKDALGNLRKLAADEGKPESIRKAADGAIKAIEGAK